MKKMLIMGITLLFLTSCSHKKAYVRTRLKNIDANITTEKKCHIKYYITKDKNVTLKLIDAQCISNKLKKCTKDRKKLIVANDALNAQINLANKE